MTFLSPHRYHEDYAAGDVFRHRRGHTVTESDNHLLSLMTMNTAQTHFNRDYLRSYMDGQYSALLVNAAVVLALAVGLSSEDMSEHAVADLGYRQFAIKAPLFAGDTMYVSSEVLDTSEQSPRPDAGVLCYHLTAMRPDEEIVMTVERRVLIKRRSHWQLRDREFADRLTTTRP
jgi:itaconyl-CoA hydratase